jgi:hypothetical protein
MLIILSFVLFYHGGHGFFFKDVMGLEFGHTTSDQVGVACPYPNHTCNLYIFSPSLPSCS